MVRPNELSFARRGALSKLAARRQGARPSQLTAVFVGLDAERDDRAVVSFDGSEVSVLAGPVKMTPGALCAVEVDSANAPVRVLGPVTVRPEGLDEDVPAPDPVTAMPELAPHEGMSEADKQILDDAVEDLGEAQQTLTWAEPMFNLLSDLGAETDDPHQFASNLATYLEIPLDQIKIVDNRGADGDVIVELYDALIVEKFLLATEVITETMLAKKSVTAPALNVVHTDPNTGYGFRLEPEGLTILDADGNVVISLRADMANYFGIIKDGGFVASIDPDGNITGNNIAVNGELTYDSRELSEILAEFPRGLVSMSRNTADASIGSSEGRLLATTFITPEDNRMIEIRVMGRISNSATRRAALRLRQSSGDTVTPLNSAQKTWYLHTDWAESFDLSVVRSTSEWGWNPGEMITVGLFIESLNSGESIGFPFTAGQEISVRDVGPWQAIQGHAPWVPRPVAEPGRANRTRRANLLEH
ncbi:hypothetical protein EJ997_10300 [Flaviflexus ciconiae]|uniref:Uncharacterized protein n=1 Tax=Flaviflexus ciconiae TaxID=2496867 RepID=A0A3S9PZ99_9ACTO|nr:hypothetical protein [Flaviflexus ciconiae]AZQ77674.1 hypothetical protein EJ997_10300 [Flaviflexus ciconiae]